MPVPVEGTFRRIRTRLLATADVGYAAYGRDPHPLGPGVSKEAGLVWRVRQQVRLEVERSQVRGLLEPAPDRSGRPVAGGVDLCS